MKPGDLNFQHLRYFHAVAHEGSVLRASRQLGLAPSTVSGQIKALEQELGTPLLERVGRGVSITAFGREVLQIADSIFELGAEVVRAASGEHRRLVRLGVSSMLPKLLVRELLVPACTSDVLLQVESGTADVLLGQLTARRLDAVLSDAPTPSWVVAPTTDHLIIQSGVAVFGTKELRETVGADLPAGLGRVPWLVPPRGTALRAALEQWWDSHGLIVDIALELDDSAVMKAMGDAGVGIFAAPEHMMEAILAGYRVDCIGTTADVRENAYVITRGAVPTDPTVRRLCRLEPEVAAE